MNGGKKLYGTANVSAAKNSVLPILAACALTKNGCTVKNAPRLSDTAAAVEILRFLGCDVSFEKNITVLPQNLKSEIPRDLMKSMRSSIFFLAPMLCVTGMARISYPGGCDLGARPIDIHLAGLEKMGAEISVHSDGTVECTAPNGLSGCEFTLRLPSVGASETLLMAASTASGTTVLHNAAKEPEICDLADFLNACGAEITGAGTDTITIKGKNVLAGCEYTPMPDRIITSTIACAVTAAGGTVFAKNAKYSHIEALANILRPCGVSLAPENGGVLISCEKRAYAAGNVKTGTYPEFATDCAPLLAAAMLCADGATKITDTVFEKRFSCAEGFVRLGANAQVNGNSVAIRGVEKLYGANLRATDLRGGAALVIAALAAKGQSIITGCGFIDRGYENISNMFLRLGADISYR